MSNFFVASFELVSAVLIASLTLIAPVICLAIVVMLVIGLVRRLPRGLMKRTSAVRTNT
jgi:flagellar biosynthesis protein FliR